MQSACLFLLLGALSCWLRKCTGNVPASCSPCLSPPGLQEPGRCSRRKNCRSPSGPGQPHSGRPGLGTAGVAGGLPPPAQECPEWLLPHSWQAHVTWADGPTFREMPVRMPRPVAPGAAPGAFWTGHPTQDWLSAAASRLRPSPG